jgi:hypothetical protein
MSNAPGEDAQPEDSLAPVAPTAAARERVVELLSRHFADDAISLDELERRLDRAYAATTTRELDALVGDLVPAPATDLTESPLALTSAPDHARIVSLFSSTERRGSYLVPRHLELKARMTYLELDLTEATFAPGLTTIDASSVMSYVKLVFPQGVHVECEGSAIFGSFELKAAPPLIGERPTIVVRVTGRAVFGAVELVVHGARRLTEAQEALRRLERS